MLWHVVLFSSWKSNSLITVSLLILYFLTYLAASLRLAVLSIQIQISETNVYKQRYTIN